MVADMAGVSRGTVDRVLNNRAHVSPEVYERVMEAIQKTGYLSPRGAYQKTLLNQNFTPLKIGVLLPNWSGHFKWEVSDGIEAAQSELTDFNVTVIVEECQTDIPEENLEKLENLIRQDVQGIALCTVNDLSIKNKIAELFAQGIPVITFNSDLPDSRRLCFVGQDYQKSGRIAAELMGKCIPSTGKVLAAVGNLEFDGHRTRLKGFCDRMQEIGFADEQIEVIETYNDYQITFKKILQAFQENSEIAAVYMANRSVSACVKAVETVGCTKKTRVICHDISERTRSLLLSGEIDFSISQDLFQQGYLPLIYLRDYLHKDKIITHQDTGSQISIICSQNL